ncbi:MAG: phosphate ABC transporter substrate-binding protein [Planctomycetes bacterium]|nr:phosphate ABC transporter substrate-binding protein [Planctomycetota bacterium]
MKSRVYCSILVLAMLVSPGGCRRSSGNRQDEGFLQIKGSDTIVNAGQMVSEEFMKVNPYIFVGVTGGGSGVGIASLINGTCDIAISSREMKAKEYELARKHGVEPNEITVAYDGVAVVVNMNNPVEHLTLDQLRRIFTGEVKNWKELGGKDMSIVTLSREVSSGTHMYFKEEVIRQGKKDSVAEFSSETLLLTSSQAIVEEVANNESAIGYLGMGYVSDRTKTVKLGKKEGDYFPADISHVLNKKYPLSRPLYFYINGRPQGIIKQFIDFTLSPRGQQQFAETGFVPLEAGFVQKNK